jgi:hypothetical protein
MTLMIAMPALKFSSEIDNLKASLLHHRSPSTDLLLFLWRWTLLYRNDTDTD